ncbi:hypothetical protein V8F20_008852 [Naviculisporaceae sp. PSN 640]
MALTAAACANAAWKPAQHRGQARSPNATTSTEAVSSGYKRPLKALSLAEQQMRFHEPHICIEGRCNLPSSTGLVYDARNRPDKFSFFDCYQRTGDFLKIPEVSITTLTIYQTPGNAECSTASLFRPTEVHLIQAKPFTDGSRHGGEKAGSDMGPSESTLARFWASPQLNNFTTSCSSGDRVTPTPAPPPTRGKSGTDRASELHGPCDATLSLKLELLNDRAHSSRRPPVSKNPGIGEGEPPSLQPSIQTSSTIEKRDAAE